MGVGGKTSNTTDDARQSIPTFKGAYDESMTAAVAAFRAGNAPHILQVFEVGTATMMASKGAIVPVAQVIHGVNAEIADGEFIVIVEPSGCGKSTLLRMVAGLEEVSCGEACIGDRVVNDLEPAERDIAMVFQNYALYPHMSVFDNMAHGLKIAKVPKDEIKTRVDKAAKILEFGGLPAPLWRVLWVRHL